jgi:hypothetical protein
VHIERPDDVAALTLEFLDAAAASPA